MEELSIVTEIGTFGDLDIKDPTVKKIVQESMEEDEELDMDKLAKKIMQG